MEDPMRQLRLVSLLMLVGATAAANPIDDLPPGQWYQAPNSHLRMVAPQNPPGDVACVIDCWSGAAFDSTRGRLVVFGGGHGQYAGNEVYVFDVESLNWTRLTDPSMDIGGDEASGYYPDGNPRSAHTYNYLVYMGGQFDRFCELGSTAYYPSGQVGTPHTDCFNFNSLKWERFADRPETGGQTGAFTGVDSSTGHAWVHGFGGSSRLAEYDPDQNQWTSHGGMWTEQIYVWGYETADIDPQRHKMVAVGHGHVLVWDLTIQGDIAAVELATQGGDAIVNASQPGFAYVPLIDRLVAWDGGTDLYALDLDNATWTKLAIDPMNAVVPTAGNGNGTDGRFRYVPSKHALMVVNSIDQDVYFFKVTQGMEALPDAGMQMPPPDMGVTDGSTPPPGKDAGTPPRGKDAGSNPSPDLAMGTIAPPSTGCTCSTSGSARSGWGLPLLLAGTLALALARRRGRASRRR
jgi:hypothetical protein